MQEKAQLLNLQSIAHQSDLQIRRLITARLQQPERLAAREAGPAVASGSAVPSGSLCAPAASKDKNSKRKQELAASLNEARKKLLAELKDTGSDVHGALAKLQLQSPSYSDGDAKPDGKAESKSRGDAVSHAAAGAGAGEGAGDAHSDPSLSQQVDFVVALFFSRTRET